MGRGGEGNVLKKERGGREGGNRRTEEGIERGKRQGGEAGLDVPVTFSLVRRLSTP